jgi:hypothetical protein
MYSLSISIRDREIKVSRYFGLVRRTFHVEDIVRFDISRPREKSPPRASITFASGDRLVVSAYALHFQDLCDYLRDREIGAKANG